MIDIIDKEQTVKIKWFTRNKKQYEDLGYKFTKLGDTFDVFLKHLNKDSHYPVNVQCDECGKEMVTPYRSYNKIVQKSGAYRCRKCNAKYTSETRINNNKERMIEDFNNLITSLGYTPLATLDDYKGHDCKMPFICDIHGVQHLSIDQLRQGCICPKCGAKRKGSHNAYSKEKVIKIVESKNNNKLLNPDEYINIDTKNLKIKCGSCGNVHIRSLSSIVNSNGMCVDCGFKALGEIKKLSYDEIIKQSTVDGKCYIINPEDYTNINTKNLKFHCITCGAVITKSLSHFTRGENRCKKCTSEASKGEYTIACLLDDLNIEYEQQKRFKDCKDKKPLPFDFYLPNYNCCIEFDGYQHYNMIPFDTDETYQKRKLHDEMKTEYCEKNNIKLIRIPYWEYQNIEQILNEELCIIELKDIV